MAEASAVASQLGGVTASVGPIGLRAVPAVATPGSLGKGAGAYGLVVRVVQITSS